jgi:uncharacterized protein
VEREPYQRGIQLFNRGAFFEAHEVLEEVWRAAPAAEKRFLQGLIQAAVAFHHHSKGNVAGARSLLVRAAKNLEGYPEGFGEIRLHLLLTSLGRWQSALAEGRPTPELPHL